MQVRVLPGVLLGVEGNLLSSLRGGSLATTPGLGPTVPRRGENASELTAWHAQRECVPDLERSWAGLWSARPNLCTILTDQKVSSSLHAGAAELADAPG